MYAGYIIEESPVRELYAHPQHPYTLGLLKSLPRLDSADKHRLTTIQGLPPLLFQEPVGCPFAPRCPFVFDRCKENPPLLEVDVNHRAACWWNIDEGKPRNV